MKMRAAYILAIALALLAGAASGQPVPDAGEWIYRTEKRLSIGCPIVLDENRNLVCADGSSGSAGGLTSPAGVSRIPGYFEEVVLTVAGQQYVETTNTIPAGAIVERCLATTLTAISGGYTLGTEGWVDLYATMDGDVGDTSDGDSYYAGDQPNYTTSPRRITSTAGAFVDSGGSVQVTCFYRSYSSGD